MAAHHSLNKCIWAALPAGRVIQCYWANLIFFSLGSCFMEERVKIDFTEIGDNAESTVLSLQGWRMVITLPFLLPILLFSQDLQLVSEIQSIRHSAELALGEVIELVHFCPSRLPGGSLPSLRLSLAAPPPGPALQPPLKRSSQHPSILTMTSWSLSFFGGNQTNILSGKQYFSYNNLIYHSNVRRKHFTTPSQIFTESSLSLILNACAVVNPSSHSSFSFHKLCTDLTGAQARNWVKLTLGQVRKEARYVVQARLLCCGGDGGLIRCTLMLLLMVWTGRPAQHYWNIRRSSQLLHMFHSTLGKHPHT